MVSETSNLPERKATSAAELQKRQVCIQSTIQAKDSKRLLKEYILHEYADVFKGVGTLPGGPYHIKLKDF